MHLIGIRKSLVEKYPWLPTSVYKAFCEAKALAMLDLRDVNALAVTLPWLEAETNETSLIMGEDFWKYGAAENRPEIEALTQYLREQGLVDRKVDIGELFHASTLDVAKI
jgi:4,5-dihydroxyphthalate decarboxylase